LKANNNKDNSYTHGPDIDSHLALINNKGAYFYHADGLGSIVAMTDSSQKVVQDYEYDSFGNLHDQKNRIKQPYTYTGRESDRETGLYFYRARYYDAEIGRFLSKDPIGFAGGMNLFAYVGNSPVNWIDPLGFGSTIWGPDPESGHGGCPVGINCVDPGYASVSPGDNIETIVQPGAGLGGLPDLYEIPVIRFYAAPELNEEPDSCIKDGGNTQIKFLDYP
jgi:RHS repeat-associated protein